MRVLSCCREFVPTFLDIVSREVSLDRWVEFGLEEGEEEIEEIYRVRICLDVADVSVADVLSGV